MCSSPTPPQQHAALNPSTFSWDIGGKFPILTGMRTLLIAIAAIFAVNAAHAEPAPYIPVGSAKTKKTVIALPELQGDRSVAKQIRETVENDLAFMDLFKFLPSSAFVEPAT